MGMNIDALREAIKEVLNSELKSYSEKMEQIEKLAADLEAKLNEASKGRKGVMIDDSDVKEFGSPEALLSIPAKEGTIVERFQDLNDNVMLLSQFLGKSPKELKTYNELQIVYKALSTGSAGSGAEWIPTGYSAKLYDMIKLNLHVAKLFDWIELPNDPYVLPIQSSGVTAYRAGEGADLTALESTPGTAKKEISTSKLAVYVPITTEMQEDSIIPVMDKIKSDIARAIAEGVENALINGDTNTAAPMDSDLTDSSDQRTIFNGLRKLTGASAKFDAGGSITVEDFQTLLVKLDKYSVMPQMQVYFIVPVPVYLQLLLLKDSAGNRVFRYLAENDPLVKGAVGRILNVPVVISPFVRTNLNASGVYDGNTTDKTIILAVNPANFIGGEKRALKVERGRFPYKDLDYLVATYRVGFTKIRDGENFTAIAYNVSV